MPDETPTCETPTLERALQDFESYIDLCRHKTEQFETYRQTTITTRLSDACGVVRDALAAAQAEARLKEETIAQLRAELAEAAKMREALRTICTPEKTIMCSKEGIVRFAGQVLASCDAALHPEVTG